MRDYKKELTLRTAFIRETVEAAGAAGIIFGNSGGKDSALAGILCKAACPDTVGVILPCGSARNFGEDKSHAEVLAEQFGIETRFADLTAARDMLIAALGVGVDGSVHPSDDSVHPKVGAQSGQSAPTTNIAPRLRMTALYTIAAAENRLVCGTGNRSEIHMGYFTKWGDGGCDFNPVADLTATEVLEFLRFLNAPACIIGKAPSAGLFEGQTDEADMGISYKKIDLYLLGGTATDADKALIERFHKRTAHKRNPPLTYT
jgi:NAD+ synthase